MKNVVITAVVVIVALALVGGFFGYQWYVGSSNATAAPETSVAPTEQITHLDAMKDGVRKTNTKVTIGSHVVEISNDGVEAKAVADLRTQMENERKVHEERVNALKQDQEATVAELRKLIDNLKAQGQNRDELLLGNQKLQQKVTNLEDQVIALNGKITALTQERDRLHNENNRLSGQLDTAASQKATELANLQRDLAKVTKERDELIVRVNAAEAKAKENANAQQAVELLTGKKAELETQVTNLQNRISELECQLKQSEEARATAESQRDAALKLQQKPATPPATTVICK